MLEKLKKVIQDDLQRRYEQLEERFLVFEQRLYGRLADRLDGLENQLDHLSDILRQKAAGNDAEEPISKEKTKTVKSKKKSATVKKTSSKEEKVKPDDLKKLSGLGEVLEKKLNAEGVYTFKQLAMLSEANLDELNKKIPGLKIRYERYEWKKESENQ